MKINFSDFVHTLIGEQTFTNPIWVILIIIVILIGSSVGSIYLGKYLRSRNAKSVWIFMVSLCAVSVAIRVLVLNLGVVFFQDPLYNNIHHQVWWIIAYMVFPLEWCSLVLYVALFAVIFKKYHWISYVMPMCMIGGIMNVAIPNTLAYWPVDSICFYAYYLTHILQVTNMILIYVIYRPRLQLREFVYGTLGCLIWQAIWAGINWTPFWKDGAGWRRAYFVGPDSFRNEFNVIPIWGSSWILNFFLLLLLFSILATVIWIVIVLITNKFSKKSWGKLLVW